MLRSPTGRSSSARQRFLIARKRLAQATAEQGILLQIDPKALKFFQNTKLANDIMMTALTLQHGNPQLLDMPPFGLYCSLVMPVSREVVGILASAMSAFPANCARLLTHRAPTPFFSSQLRRDLCFQKGHEYPLSGLQGGFFDLFLDGLNDFFAFFPDDFGIGNGYTHGG